MTYKQTSESVRKWWNIDSSKMDKFMKDYMESIRGLMYILSDDPDDKESAKRMDSTYEATRAITCIKELMEKYEEIYHKLNVMVSIDESYGNWSNNEVEEEK